MKPDTVILALSDSPGRHKLVLEKGAWSDLVFCCQRHILKLPRQEISLSSIRGFAVVI